MRRGHPGLPAEEVVRRSLKRQLGHGWRHRDTPISSGHEASLVHPSGLTVIVSRAIWEDGAEWCHASIAHPDRDPTYQELKALHRAVFGDRYAYQVFAPPAQHVNIHEHALHLWGRVDGTDVLPNFGRAGTI